MARSIFKILGIFVIGIVGGIFADQILWPYFVERPLFYKYELDKFEQRPIYVTEKKEIVVRENVALQMMVEQVERAVVGVKTKTRDRKTLEGAGLVVTSDGLIVTLADLLPRGSDFYFYLDGKYRAFQVLERDLKSNLALVKINDDDIFPLSATGFADLEKLKLGERIFLTGMNFTNKEPGIFVNEGIIKYFDKDLIQTNILEKTRVAGSPVFDIEGNAVGLSVVDEGNAVSIIPITKIRAFIGL